VNIDLIEKHRDINTEHFDWWDCVYETFYWDMAKVGIHVSDRRFSGFWSQGDGASFTGSISDSKAFMETHDLTETYPTVMRYINKGGDVSIRIERTSHHYVHENTVSAEIRDPYYTSFRTLLPSDDGGIRDAVISHWDTLLDKEIDELESHVTEIIRDYCVDLYRRLEKEYDYLTSDEAVWDAIVANDLDVIEEMETV
jgi:hypothetical protein